MKTLYTELTPQEFREKRMIDIIKKELKEI